MTRIAPDPGPLLFARYAHPPNALGYCGPDDHRALLEHAAWGVADRELRELARGFQGAWPYLRLIAGAAGIADPLDRRVVEAYWIGGPALHRVDAGALCSFLDERFRPMSGSRSSHLIEAALRGAVPHHNFHVFCVSPWVGLLREGRVEEPLRVLDRCRIRWGTVVEVAGGVAVVRSRRLVWDGRTLRLGPPRPERVTVATDDLAAGGIPERGSVVAMHWDRVCEPLDRAGLAALRRETARALRAANHAGLVGALGA